MPPRPTMLGNPRGDRIVYVLKHLNDLLRDLRYAFRMLAVQPAWTLAAITCLAIATGANTAAYSVVNAVLLRPLPFPKPDQLIMLALKAPEGSDTRPFALREYLDLAPQATDITELAAYTFMPVSVSANGGARMAEGQVVSRNYFELLQVSPLAGRFFDEVSDGTIGTPQIVISEQLWRQQFAADSSVVGKVVRVNGRPMIVSGIAPPGFVGAMGLIASDLWLPTALYPSLARAPDSDRVPMFGVIGRRSAGVTNEQARERLDLLVSSLARDRGLSAAPTVVVERASGFGVPPAVRRRSPAAVGVMFGLAGLLIAVASANVAALVLARGTRRVREMGVRLALGATGTRLARQLLTESFILALLGSAAGLLLSFWVTHALQPGASQFEYVSFAVNITPDLRVFAYAAGGAIVTAAVFGLVPAYRAARTDLNEVLKPAGGAGRSPSTTRALRTLVVGQIAVSTILLMGAGLLARTYLNTRAVDPGFDTRNIVSVSIDLDPLGLSVDAGRRFYDELSAAVMATPGVEGMSMTREAPLSPTGRDLPIWLGEAAASERVAGPHDAGSFVVTPGHFDLAGIRLVQGQLFTRVDANGPLVAVINETMARRFWSSTSPIGRTFHLREPLSARVEIIGVVKDAKYRSLTEEPRPVFYQPFAQQYAPRMTMLVRHRSAPYPLMATIRQQIASLNPDLPAMQSRTLDDHLERAIAPRRQSAFLLSIVGVIGLLLATIGLYGVISFGVRSRAREFGIRIALGATSRDVLLSVFGPGLRIVGSGLAVGVGTSLMVTRLFASLLFGVQTDDPLTIAVVCGSLLAVASLALYLPARWATNVEPTIALRHE